MFNNNNNNNNNNNLILTKRRNLELIYKKKMRTCLVNFANLVNHRARMKEIEALNKYLDLAKELKKCGT